VTLCAFGCERAPGTPVQPLAQSARPQVQAGLFLTSSHVVVSPELMLGVLTVRNVGTAPIALVDRWNSWGAYQWWLSIGTESAGNPQCSWYRNFYSESVIAPGELRHAWFQVTRSRKNGPVRESAWWFMTGGFTGATDWNDESIPRFRTGDPVTLTLNGAFAQEGGLTSMIGLWTGCATVRSTELVGLKDLEALVAGKPLQ
jgi:hypothetical protein